MLERTSGDLASYHLLDAVRADLLRRSRRFEEAADAYRHAIALTSNAIERAHLNRRLTEATELGQKR